jgi:hypothetical protein
VQTDSCPHPHIKLVKNTFFVDFFFPVGYNVPMAIEFTVKSEIILNFLPNYIYYNIGGIRMQRTLVWKQTSETITQVPLSQVVTDVAGKVNWPPEKVEKELVEEKKLLKIPGAKYHIWRDSLY